MRGRGEGEGWHTGGREGARSESSDTLRLLWGAGFGEGSKEGCCRCPTPMLPAAQRARQARALLHPK